MAITVEERPDSRRTIDAQRSDRTYLIRGTASEADALTALKAAAPTSVSGVGARKDVSVDPVYIDEDTPDACTWMGAVNYLAPEYTPPSPPSSGSSSYAFDTTGGTQRVTQAQAHVNTYAKTGHTPEDFKGAIGVSGDGQSLAVEGVDVTVRQYAFSETHIIPAATVTDTYKGTLFALTGTVNSEAFKGLAAGECLFLGARGQKRGDGDWEITFRFAGSRNRSSFSVGDVTVGTKLGWDVMWIRYATVAGSKRFTKQPVAVYVEHVYPFDNHNALGI